MATLSMPFTCLPSVVLAVNNVNRLCTTEKFARKTRKQSPGPISLRTSAFIWSVISSRLSAWMSLRVFFEQRCKAELKLRQEYGVLPFASDFAVLTFASGIAMSVFTFGQFGLCLALENIVWSKSAQLIGNLASTGSMQLLLPVVIQAIVCALNHLPHPDCLVETKIMHAQASMLQHALQFENSSAEAVSLKQQLSHRSREGFRTQTNPTNTKDHLLLAQFYGKHAPERSLFGEYLLTRFGVCKLHKALLSKYGESPFQARRFQVPAEASCM